MANISDLSDEKLKRKIKSAKIAIERNAGAIKAASEKKLAKLEDELEKRAGAVEVEVKEEVEEVYEDRVEKKAKKPVAKKEKKAKKAKKPVAKKEKKAKKAKPRVYGSPTANFTLKIDGVDYTFADLKSKEACQKAIKAVKARRTEQVKQKEAAAEGRERAKTIPVTQRITDGFASIAKKAVAEVPTTKIEKKPVEIKKEIDAVEKAFTNLFDKLEELMDRKIPATQRKQIMDILTKFEEKVEKGADKKEEATSKVRKKEDGGFAGEVDDSWSYISLM